MATAMKLPDGQTLEIIVEQVDVTSNLSTVDESWTYTDRAGHQHAYVSEQGWPTLRRVVDETYWCDDCNDEHETSHWECLICAEVIEPGMRGPDMFRRTMPGRTEYLLDGRPITPDEARRIIDGARRP